VTAKKKKSTSTGDVLYRVAALQFENDPTRTWWKKKDYTGNVVVLRQAGSCNARGATDEY